MLTINVSDALGAALIADGAATAASGAPIPPTPVPVPPNPNPTPPSGGESSSFNRVVQPPAEIPLSVPLNAQSGASGYISAAEYGSPPGPRELTISLNGQVIARNTSNTATIFVALTGQHSGFGYTLLTPGQTYIIGVAASGQTIVEAHLPW